MDPWLTSEGLLDPDNRDHMSENASSRSLQGSNSFVENVRQPIRRPRVFAGNDRNYGGFRKESQDGTRRWY